MTSDAQPYGGIVGNTVADSTPWWPDPVTPPPDSPNIVMVVLDDVGFADLGCFGSEVDTPIMDGLAASGLRYNNFHTTAICSPTRACLLTGRNHHSVGMAVVSNWDTGFPGCTGRITNRAATLAEILRPAGYSTFAVGKWHLAPIEDTTPAGPFDQWPLQRGFDRYYGFLDGATNQWDPDLVADNHHIDRPDRPGYHVTEDLVDQAIAMVTAQTSAWPERPFFLYLCFGTGHYPIHVPKPYIDRYDGRYDGGWGAIRQQRYHRQRETGIIPADTELPPFNPGVPEWEELSADEQRVAARMQQAYAGMLTHTDEHLSRLVARLHEIGRATNTVFVLLSDNGATQEGGPSGHENSMRFINGLEPRSIHQQLTDIDEIGGPNSWMAYPMGWAMAGNTPLKWYKQNTHAGGVRDPLIISWADGIADGGSVRTQYHHVSDITPTLLEVIGLDPPTEVAGIDQMPMEGTSMVYSFADADAPTAKAEQYFEMLGHRAMWADGWKAVTRHIQGESFDDDRWELYHLDQDFSEAQDLAETEPDRLAELIDQWWVAARTYQVLPLDDRILERFHVPKPRPITSRSRFVYYPGAYIPSDGCPDLKNVSYEIAIHLERATGDNGTLLACGDVASGFSLFVQDGRLVWDYNMAWEHYVAETPEALPTGPVTVTAAFERTGSFAGISRLLVGGAEVASVAMPQTHNTHIHAVGISVGFTRAPSPSPRYAGQFPFTGHITQAVITLANDRESPTQALILD